MTTRHFAPAEATGAPSSSQQSGRVLFLSGTWSIPGDAFSLQAMLAVAADGHASGPIAWQATRTAGPSGIEEVRGRVGGNSVHLYGFKAERGLACDQYKIVLSGHDQRGTFVGSSWAFGSWNGRMQGNYEFWSV